MNDLTVSRDDVHAILLASPDSYRVGARKFVHYLSNRNLDLTASAIRQYVEDIRRQYTAAHSQNYYINSMLHQIRKVVKLREPQLSIAQRWAIEEQLKTIRRAKIQYQGIPQDKILSPEEIRSLIDYTAPAQTHISLMLRFLWQTGCRVSEMLAVRLGDLKDAGKVYNIKLRGKGGKERTVRVSTQLANEIRTCGWFHQTEYLFQSPYRNTAIPYDRSYVSMRISRAAKLLLNRKVSAHTIRHSLATHLIKTTGRVKAVANLLGHSSTSTTLRLYVHDNFTAEELEALW